MHRGLQEERAMTEEEEDIFFGIINRFVGLHSRDAARKTGNDTSCEYPFVAMDSRQVFEQVRFTARYLARAAAACPGQPPRFLDIGCGIGNVLLIAEQFGFDVRGIEKDPYSFPIAARLIGQDKIFQADIWSYEGYGDFEVLYYFRPFCQREQQLRFERLVEDRMRPGAVLIANHKNSDVIGQDPRFVRLATELPIWQKTAS